MELHKIQDKQLHTEATEDRHSLIDIASSILRLRRISHGITSYAKYSSAASERIIRRDDYYLLLDPVAPAAR